MKSIRFGIVPSIIIGMSLCCTEIHGITFENEIQASKQARANEWTSDAHSEITHNLFNFINNNQIITTQWFNSYQLIIMLFSIIYTIRMYDGIVGIDISLSLSLSLSFADIDRQEEKKKTDPIDCQHPSWYIAFRYLWFHYSHLFVRELDYIFSSFVASASASAIDIDIDLYSFLPCNNE